MDIETYVIDIAKNAKMASRVLGSMNADLKNRVLSTLARLLDEERRSIVEANNVDMARGEKSGLSKAFLDRLQLGDKGIDGMIRSVQEIMILEDPVGQVEGVKRPQGFTLEKVLLLHHHRHLQTSNTISYAMFLSEP